MVNLNFGDYVEIISDSDSFEGSLMSDSSKANIVLKLKNGYNVGIDKKKIKKMKLIKKRVEEKIKSSNVADKKDLPTILILHTGGTIASKVDYKTGGVIAKFSPSELIEMFPTLKKIANIESKLIGNILSEDMRFSHYNLIAEEIKKNHSSVDGIIVTHGTDTMHYTSAALSFMLEDLGIPILLVGSQKSSDRGSTDARMNIICAAQFIANSEFAEVGICMHSTTDDENCYILPGLKTKKLHSSRRDAFTVVNAKPFAKVDEYGKITYIRTVFDKKNKDKKIKVHKFEKNVKVGFIKSHPNMIPEEISNYSNFDGLIVEGTGLGHLPVNKIDDLTIKNDKIFTELKKLSKSIPIVMCSQTTFGRVNMNVYSTGRKIQEYLISGDDMTSETAFVKLAWLLSQKEKNICKKMTENLKGEFNPRISDEFL
ncbi:Glu-tRNA(Gln) amidotransferase subunit GatD [archaeon]|jgi:glutamyl-tRNA(Gln) amidotransferase subunit D|nr:Glu-tRNA(Gln) amidotransferase subunit GatD [archaeon]